MKHLRMSAAVLVLGLAMLSLCPCPPAVQACAVAPPRNQAVAIADESAIILWDAKTKTQHFIRRASFKTEAANFGFLVPTPSKPKLAEAGDEAFGELAKITAPRVVTQSAPSGGGGGCIGCAAAWKAKSDGAPSGQVQVLDEQRVAGYDTAILQADDADKLGEWLQQHEYEFSPRLVEWVRPYVKAKWLITAFKIAKKTADEPSVGTSAVRMTFQTDQPIFPYREPPEPVTKDEPKKTAPARLLRIYFLSDSRVQGTIGDKGSTWPGKTVWANHLTAEQRDPLLKQLKLDADAAPPTWWLTEFEDHSSPRPGTDDVYFAPSTDQSTVEREPHVKYVSRKVPDCVMCYALAAYMVVPCLIRFVRKKK